jgi:prepilin-type N-terminal cleavage/methylation domain-containing protein
MMKKKRQKKIKLLQRNKTGFSLIEVSIVVCIVVIIVSLGLPTLGFYRHMDITNELDTLYLTIAQLQHAALTSNTKQVLNIDVRNNAYHWNGQTHKLRSTVNFGSLPYAKGPPSSPTIPIHNPCTFHKNQIIFYPDGHIESGSVYMIALKSNFMYAICIGVTQVSFIRKYRYNQGWKQLS